MTHLDAHIAIFISTRNDRRVRSLRKRLETEDVVLSAAAWLEIQLLNELGRITESAAQIFDDLSRRFEVRLSPTAFSTVVEHALSLSWTRDPMDRLIVANAAVDGAKLLTFDEHIHEHFADAVWR